MIKMKLRSAKLPLVTPLVPVCTKTKSTKTKKVAVPAQNIQVQATNEIIDELTLRSAASHIEPVQEQPTPTQPTLELEAEVEDEPVLTPKKKRTVLKYESIKEEFKSYTDIDT